MKNDFLTPRIIVVCLVGCIFLVPVYSAIIRTGHSVSDDLYQMFVYTTCTAFWCKWIAGKPQIQKNETTTPS